MNLKLVLLDVDGVMCDGKIYDFGHGIAGKIFNDLDFSAIKVLKCLDIPVVLLTSDGFNLSMSLKRQVEFFNGRDEETNKIDKLKVYEKIKAMYGVEDDSQIAYIGDDRFDIPVLEKVGYAFCPSNSPYIVRSVKDIIQLKGRSGENLVSAMLDWFVYRKILVEPSLDALQEIDSKE